MNATTVLYDGVRPIGIREYPYTHRAVLLPIRSLPVNYRVCGGCQARKHEHSIEEDAGLCPRGETMMLYDALGVNWRLMMDAAHLPMVVLDPDLRLLYRNPASNADPVFSSIDPGEYLTHTGLRAAGPLRERTEARHEFIEACARGGGPQCLSETRRVGGTDRMIFWICVRTTSDAGDLLLVIGLGGAWDPSNSHGTRQSDASLGAFRLPLVVISGQADTLADLLEQPLSDRASAIGRTARHMLARLDRMGAGRQEACES